MVLTQSGFTSYEDALKAFVGKNEGNKTQFYSDKVGVPTIGAGYALTKHSNWLSDFTAAGISLTSAQKTALSALVNYAKNLQNLTQAQREALVSAKVAAYNNTANSIKINGYAGKLFVASKKPYEDMVINVLGDSQNTNTGQALNVNKHTGQALNVNKIILAHYDTMLIG